MDFTIKNIKENIVVITRKIGYVLQGAKDSNEYSIVRKLTHQNYPRFHIYVRQAGDRLYFNLHLDQKKPSYEGSHAHSGEYEGPIIDEEADRIKKTLDL